MGASTNFAPAQSSESAPTPAPARMRTVDVKMERAQAIPVLMNNARTKAAPVKPKLGLRAWMERVLVECDHAAAGFDADPVHDLRVALRRCRSLADGLMAIDPDGSWKQMKKAGRKLFRALGDLRDMQVMQEWIEKLAKATDGKTDDVEDPVAVKVLDHVHARENECKRDAFKDLQQFDHKQWREWSRMLPKRAARVRPGSAVYLHLALEKWTDAYELHKQALRVRSQVAWHALRIGIKRFRYTVENFLPRQHAEWGDDLKELQDLLGEVHDLDVLWATAVEIMAFPDVESQRRWRERLNEEREKRIERYREKMVGRESLWRVWRAGLPEGEQLRAAAMSRLRVWAGYLDPDFAHSERVARLALDLYDGLHEAGLLKAAGAPSEERGARLDARTVLLAAALLHDVGKAKSGKNHHKASYRMIRGLERPLAWSEREMQLAAAVARYHRGALPRRRSKTMQSVEPADRLVAMETAGILRLANALDLRHVDAQHGNENNRSVSKAREARLEVAVQDHAVVVRAARYSTLDRSAEAVAAARHLLETVLRRPVVVRGLRRRVGTHGVTGRAG